MYCVKCGVELADSEKKCPLCGTVVFHPDVDRAPCEKPYPLDMRQNETVSRSGLLFIMTAIFVFPLVITLLCDFQFNSGITWSGYTTGAILFSYVTIVLPRWFRRPNPVIFVPADFIAAGVYLFYINWATNGDWFIPFAMPVVLGLMIILTCVIALTRYVGKGHIFVFGGGFIVTGCFSVVVEYLINRVFSVSTALRWSVYPLAGCVLLGAMLIVIGLCRPVRESLKKKFFL